MDLFAEYMKEREGCETLVTKDGFVTAKVVKDNKDNNVLFINDFFIKGEARRKRSSAIKLFNQTKNTALKLDCKKIQAIIYANTLNATESLKANLYYGFKLVAAHEDKIYVEIEL